MLRRKIATGFWLPAAGGMLSVENPIEMTTVHRGPFTVSHKGTKGLEELKGLERA